MEKLKVITSDISKGSFSEFIDNIFNLSDNNSSAYVCFANVHMVIESYKDPSFNEVLNDADIVAPDGGPISKTMSLFYKYKQERVCGMDLLPALLTEAMRRQKSVFFYGSSENVLKAIRNRASEELPTLKIAGTYSPPYRKLSQEEDDQIIQMINSSGAHLVFVALGCPKQEKWMADHKNKVNACMLGVGQAFLVYAGLEKRLPPWARNLSLEWVYRLYLEPRRLFKRYFYTNTLFLILLTRIILLRARSRTFGSSIKTV